MRFYDRAGDLMYLTRSLPGWQVNRMENRRFAMQRINRRHKPRQFQRKPLGVNLRMFAPPIPHIREMKPCIVMRALERGHDLLPGMFRCND